MTVRMGVGAAKGLLAMFCRGEPHQHLHCIQQYKIFCIFSYAEIRVDVLQEKPMWTQPISVDDVRLPVTVEVSERDSSSMLVAVRHTFTIYMEQEIFSC